MDLARWPSSGTRGEVRIARTSQPLAPKLAASMLPGCRGAHSRAFGRDRTAPGLDLDRAPVSIARNCLEAGQDVSARVSSDPSVGAVSLADHLPRRLNEVRAIR